jgi:hypothetical protein
VAASAATIIKQAGNSGFFIEHLHWNNGFEPGPYSGAFNIGSAGGNLSGPEQRARRLRVKSALSAEGCAARWRGAAWFNPVYQSIA